MPLVKKTPLPKAVFGPQDGSALATLLQNGTEDQRWAAARALAAVPEGVQALADALAKPADPRLREAIFTSLAGQNSPAGYEVIILYLRSDDAALRSLAMDAMHLIPDQTRQRLPALLQDDDPDVRILACELGRQIPPEEAASLLVRTLETEPQVNVCAAAIEVLAEIGGQLELAQIAACAARFPSETFLNFSTKAAIERIRARAKS